MTAATVSVPFFAFSQVKQDFETEKQKYAEETQVVFEQLYRHFYAKNVMPAARDFQDSIKANAISVFVKANALVESTFRINDIVKKCFSDASNILKYEACQHDKPQFSEIFAHARKGEINEAVAMTKEHIRLDDNSRENLEWIDLYRFLSLLKSSDEDEDTLKFYTDFLCKNHFEPYSAVEYVNDLDSASSMSDSTLYLLYDSIYNASLENYKADTANLFLQLQLAENAVQWLQNVPEVEGRALRQKEILEKLTKLEFKLSETFPEFYTMQNVQVASQYVGSCLVTSASNEELLRAFRMYEQSYDVVNAAFPNAFNEIYLNYNVTLETFLVAYQQFALSSELSAFSDRLISIEAKNDPQKIMVMKAEFNNHIAEVLYRNEMYEESVAYYLQANDLYEKAIPQDAQRWGPYLNNYLQMGDAHLNLNQFDRAMITYQKIEDFEPKIPASFMPKYMTMKGSSHYYVGDVYKNMGETARAEKEYKTAEKYFKKAISLGDKDAYALLGEMSWGKAVMAAQNKDMKKCRQMVEQSVAYYEKSQLERPYHTYERAKSVMGDFYKEAKDAPNYYKNVAELTDYYRKFVDYDDEYPFQLLQNAETMLNSGAIDKEEAIQYSQDLLDALLYLNDQGRDVKLAYLRAVFNMAHVYSVNDSVSQAIDLYRDCIQASAILYADTAPVTHKSNLVEVYSKLADCYEQMAEVIDTAHSELWYYRAVDTRDTLISLLNEINDDGDVNMTYKTALKYRQNAVVFYHLDMVPSAQDYLDKSNELLLMLYNSEYMEDVEEEIVKNYYLKGVIYEESNNNEKAVLNLRKAVEYGGKSKTVSPMYFEALNDLIVLLQLDKEANAAEIEKLTKLQKEVAKKLR